MPIGTLLKNELEQLIPQPQLLQLTGWDRSTLWHLRRHPTDPIPHTKIGGRIFYREPDILAWIERHSISAHGNSISTRAPSDRIKAAVKRARKRAGRG